jgi:hypothetical protein
MTAQSTASSANAYDSRSGVSDALPRPRDERAKSTRQPGCAPASSFCSAVIPAEDPFGGVCAASDESQV